MQYVVWTAIAYLIGMPAILIVQLAGAWFLGVLPVKPADVFIYNVQPGIEIDYKTGESKREELQKRRSE